MNPSFFLIIWLAWAGVCLAALVFIIARPAVWGRIVDRENGYWVRRGWLSGAFVEKIKKLETGITMKILLGANLLICVVMIGVLLHSASQRHFRAAMPPPPPRPVTHRPPGH